MSNKFLADFYQQLNPDNTMTFNRLLAHSIGAVETIIFFTLVGKFYYYSDREMLEEDGWFYVTVPDLHESTSFGEKVQRNAIKHLENIGFIQTAIKGVPPKRYFKVNNDMELLQEYLVKGKEISDGILIKASEDNAKKVAAANKKKRKKDDKCTINPVDSQFLPNGGINSANIDGQLFLDEKTEKSPANGVESQFLPKGRIDSAQTAELIPPKGQNRFRPNGRIDSAQMAEFTYKSKSNKSKYNKSINQDTYSCDDLGLIDEMDVKNKIEYERLRQELDAKQLDNIVSLVTEILNTQKAKIKIAGENLDTALVKQRFSELTAEHIRYVLECISQSSGIRNIRQYLLTSLYNAPATMESYYAARERPDKSEKTQHESEHSYRLDDYKALVNNFPEISP